MVDKQCQVAYFSAEYGLQADLPLYAGGLGVLSGDTVKEAADMNLPFVAVGLLYRGDKAIQKIDEHGWQTEEDWKIDPVECGFEHVYAPDDPDQPLFVRIHLTKEDVWARIWKRTVNNTTLYLLDTDTDQNEQDDRGVTHALYYGSEEVLVKQQMILGIGGVKLLKALDVTPQVFHVNEGRPAFLFWQLIRQFMDEGSSYKDAAERAKNMIVYTNHTLVRAGNQAYDSNLLKNFALYYAEKMGVTIDELLQVGIDPTIGKFSMTQFALNTSRKASAVSQVHYELSKNLWPGYDWVGITNGVHLPTWQDQEIRDCDKSGDDLWHVHLKKKQELADFVGKRTGFGYDPNRLVLCWARRFAGYKRPNSLFEEVERLGRILKDEKKPVQLLMAGKAHAKDEGGKKMLQQIVQHMQKELAGHAVFVPNYDIDVARMLVKGVDVWVNTPIQGQEASGTSGMKALSNGGLQLTVEDGWAAEEDWHGLGWTLDSNHVSATFYFRLEEDIVSAYYKRDESGIPREWLQRMKKSVELAHKYSSQRMLKQYQEFLYTC